MISDDEIRRAVSQRAFEAGLQYQMDGRVLDLRTAADGVTLEAEVKGKARSPYRQSVRLTRDARGKLQPSGLCTCPVGFNCKHVAAVLLEYQELAELASEAAPPPPVVTQKRHPSRPNGATVDAPLPYEVANWLRSLDAAQEEESEDYPPTVRKRLLYVLDRGAYSGGVTVAVHSIELKRDGMLPLKSTRHQPDQLLRAGQQPKFLRPSDRILLRQIMSLVGGAEEAVTATLQGIIATGRGRWASWNGPILAAGPAVRGELDWNLTDDGSQRPDLTLPERFIVLRLATPWYVDPATGTMGPVETALPPRVVHAMLAGPALPRDVADRVRVEMERRWPGQALPAPKPIASPKPLRERLLPHLLLLAGELPFDPGDMFGDSYHRLLASGSHRVALGRLSWRYGPVTLPAALPFQPERTLHQDGELFRVFRDRAGEQRSSDIVRQLGLARLGELDVLPGAHPHAGDLMLLDPDPAAWLDFVFSDVPRLRDDGWLVEIADDFPWKVVEPEGDISVALTERSGLDWFDLDLGVVVDGERISLAPALLDFIAQAGAELVESFGVEPEDPGLPLLLPLPDGRLLNLSIAQLRPILGPLLELLAGGEIDAASGAVRLSRGSAGDLALLEAADCGIAWSGGEAVRALGRQLREHGGIPPCPVPAAFGAPLRPYQEQGLAWLQFLRSTGLGGVLADDMGLGKTVQALAHLVVEQEAGRTDLPSLVICPTSLVPNWLAETARFAPTLRCLVLHGPARAQHFDALAAQDLVITTYPLLARDHATLSAQEWHVVLLDEAQVIKNPLATTSKLARTLRARQRLCLSGTPLENHLGELWSLFDFLLPGLLGNRKQFGTRYRGPIEKAGNGERQALLAQRVAPFLLRRTKEQVATDLPPKTEIAETVEMGAGQHAIYEGIRLAMHAKVRDAIAKRGLAGSGIVILDALLKLRQACCDPRLLKLTSAKAAKAKSAKLERLLELVPQMIEEGRRVLLFSQFTSMLALIEAELADRGLPYVLLTGDTRDRTTPVRQFQSGAVKLFLISLKAGGVGLNLTAADTVIHYDPWWNPAVENQATDRAHRIGQDKPVFVHRLITAGSIEEKMETLKRRKQALADGILGASTSAAAALTETDLEMLFAE